MPPKYRTSQASILDRPAQSMSRRKPVADLPAGSPRTSKCILLVDDDPTVRGSLNDVLVEEGYHVIPAENGQQALEFAGKFPFDLILLDLNMPVKNGWDTFGEMTAQHPFIPIIIATGRPSQLFKAVGAGAGALLEKPLDIPTLLRTMEKLLSEPAEKRLARLAGVKTDFHYQPAATSHEWPLDAHFGYLSLDDIKA